MFFSLSDAAKKVGMSRSSIYRLIDEGKLSATTDHRGKKVVELTELLRVFGSIQEGTRQEDNQEEQKHKPTTQHGTTGKTGQDTLFSTVRELEQLRFQVQLKDMELRLKDQEISSTKELLNQVKKTSEQMHQEKAQLLQIIERQTLLLAAPKPTPRSTTTRTAPVKATKAAAPIKQPPQAKKTAVKPSPSKTTARILDKPTKAPPAPAAVIAPVLSKLKNKPLEKSLIKKKS